MKLQALYGHFKKNKESRWIMQPENAARLYRLVKDRPIKRVLELGTGIGLSAAVVALAMIDKGEKEGVIDTLEQNEKCIDLAIKMIPKDFHESVKINIFKAGVKLWSTEHIPHHEFSIYDEVPEGEYDLILNDGPSPFLENGHYIDLPNGTVHKMLLEEKIKTGTLVAYDGRVQSFSLLERFFSKCFFLVKPSQGGRDFNLIERKEGPVVVEDHNLEAMKLLGYFDGNKKEDLHSDNSAAAPSETTSIDTGTKKEV